MATSTSSLNSNKWAIPESSDSRKSLQCIKLLMHSKPVSSSSDMVYTWHWTHRHGNLEQFICREWADLYWSTPSFSSHCLPWLHPYFLTLGYTVQEPYSVLALNKWLFLHCTVLTSPIRSGSMTVSSSSTAISKKGHIRSLLVHSVNITGSASVLAVEGIPGEHPINCNWYQAAAPKMSRCNFLHSEAF